MKSKFMAIILVILMAASVSAADFVPRIAIQHPQQVMVFIHPAMCEDRRLPSIPNHGVIYLIVYTSHDTNALYIELNGEPLKDEVGDVVFYPHYTPDRLEIIPIYIHDQYEPHIITAIAENEYGRNTVYAAFIPVPTGKGHFSDAIGCTTMY
jgi:hypothetical protein